MDSETDRKKRSVERSSSFARSFYRGGGSENSGRVQNNSFTVPRGRPMGRRQSSRRSDDGPPLSSSTAAAAAALVPENEPLDDGFKLPPESEGRTDSWYEEALQQGNSPAEIEKVFGNVPAAEENESAFGEFDDEEVLEQYRIMAQHEANLRVKENTGFDIAEYEKRRKLQGNEPTDKRELYGGGKKFKIRFPDPKKLMFSFATPKPEEPPLPPPRLNMSFVEQQQPFVPELCSGVIHRGTSVPNDEHIVRCLGCSQQLCVKILATLVGCPDCKTVSPASSTRR